MGDVYWVIKGDTRSLDYSSYRRDRDPWGEVFKRRLALHVEPCSSQHNPRNSEKSEVQILNFDRNPEHLNLDPLLTRDGEANEWLRPLLPGGLPGGLVGFMGFGFQGLGFRV